MARDRCRDGGIDGGAAKHPAHTVTQQLVGPVTDGCWICWNGADNQLAIRSGETLNHTGDVANRWVGRVVCLQEASDTFKLHVLLGEPSLESLRPAFIKAENILNKMPGEKEFIREREALDFSRSIAEQIAVHDQTV